MNKELKPCDGCRHILSDGDGWCYMFKDEPETLPCGQHNMYAEQRKITGQKIYEKMLHSVEANIQRIKFIDKLTEANKQIEDMK